MVSTFGWLLPAGASDLLILPAGSTGARVSQEQCFVVFRYASNRLHAYGLLWLVLRLLLTVRMTLQSPFRLFEVQSLQMWVSVI